MTQENPYCRQLREKMQEQEHSEEYIKLCISYAKKLLERSLPVIFDMAHIGEILKLENVKTEYY